MNSTTTRYSLALLAGLSLVGALASCSSTAATPGTGTDAGTDSGTAAGTDAPAGGPYADGTYEATGDYQSPNGTETVDVTITLESEIITSATVVGFGESPNSKRFQGEFIGGIGDVVVGKDIDDISVSKVAGSSLTSGGFNAAIDAIKADAAG